MRLLRLSLGHVNLQRIKGNRQSGSHAHMLWNESNVYDAYPLQSQFTRIPPFLTAHFFFSFFNHGVKNQIKRTKHIEYNRTDQWIFKIIVLIF